METILYLGGLLALLAVTASFSAAETAIVGIPHAKAHSMLKEGRWGAASLHRLKRGMRRTLTAILVANNIFNTLISSLATLLAVSVLGEAWLGVAIGVIFFVVLMAGEIFPKTISTAYMGIAACVLAPWIEAIAFILSPVIAVVQFVPDRMLGHRDLGKTIVSEREIHELIELGVAENVLEKGETAMIKRVLLFNDIAVKEIMTPMERVAKLSADEAVEDAVRLVSVHDYTRYPLVDARGGIVGSLRVKLLFDHVYSKPKMRLSQIMDSPLFLNGAMKIDDAFALMKEHHRHIAYVKEQGAVVGIVTTEDILGELVGEY